MVRSGCASTARPPAARITDRVPEPDHAGRRARRSWTRYLLMRPGAGGNCSTRSGRGPRPRRLRRRKPGGHRPRSRDPAAPSFCAISAGRTTPTAILARPREPCLPHRYESDHMHCQSCPSDRNLDSRHETDAGLASRRFRFRQPADFVMVGESEHDDPIVIRTSDQRCWRQHAIGIRGVAV